MGIVNVVGRNWLAENASTASCEREKKIEGVAKDEKKKQKQKKTKKQKNKKKKN